MEIIARQTASQMLSLFDYAYKKGVRDAAEVGDTFYCEDFIARRKDPTKFGLLDIDGDIEFREWKFYITMWASDAKLRNLYGYIMKRGNATAYYTAFYQIAQDFYTMGVKEWLEYSNPFSLEVFRSQTRVHWAPVNGRTLKPFSVKEFVVSIQKFSFERRRKSSEYNDPMSANSYDLFSIEMWRATQPLPKIRGDY